MTTQEPETPQLLEFTKRERYIITLLCLDIPIKEMGEVIHVSSTTVRSDIKKIIEKIGAKNVVGVAKYAIRTGMYKIR